MSLLAYPLVAMAGGVVGTVLHEATHAALAVALGELEGVGWQGGLAGGPYVDFRASTWLRSEVVRKAPIALGVGGIGTLVWAFDGLSLPWLFGAGVVGGLLWASPADLFRARSEAAAAE